MNENSPDMLTAICCASEECAWRVYDRNVEASGCDTHAFIAVCCAPDECARLLNDCQPRLAYIPRMVRVDPVWVVLVAFDHPIFTPFDVIFVEDDVAVPIQAAFR